MARKVDETLEKWAGRASDDVDLRTEEGILESAQNLSSLRAISLEDALNQVRAKLARKKQVSATHTSVLRRG